MDLHITWVEIAIRLGLALLAGGIIGLDRNERGKPAGLRTTLLVGLAAAVTMVMVNLLISTKGKTSDSFVQLDMMRLPLGLLTGMGFIGAGAIVRKGESVQGVTTAATLWCVTIIGLAFGSGLLTLGMVAFVLALIVLTLVAKLETILPQQQDAYLTLLLAEGDFTAEDIRKLLGAAKCNIVHLTMGYSQQRLRRMECRLRYHARRNPSRPPPFVEALAANPAIKKLRWKC
jgi:putative Mg2+ transporter-C (MgtC) family protein